MGFKTQSDLATAIGSDQPTVARWESGTYFPSDAYLEKLREVLNVENDFFFNKQTELETDTSELMPIVTKENIGPIQKFMKTQDSRMIEMINRIDELESRLEEIGNPQELSKNSINHLTADELFLLDSYRKQVPLYRELGLAFVTKDPHCFERAVETAMQIAVERPDKMPIALRLRQSLNHLLAETASLTNKKS